MRLTIGAYDMPTRLFAVLVICLTLSGCILQSREPIFSSTDGEPLLDGYGTRFASYSLKNESWEKEKDTVGFTAKGKHYEFRDEKSVMEITFAKVSGSWWVMQAEEAGNPVYYSLVEAEPEALYVYPVDCKALREAGKLGSFVEFRDDDCFVKDGVDTAAMFAALAADPGPPTMKLAAER